MFTGIVEELGRVAGIEQGEESAVLRIEGPLVVADATPGASISVNGVCLTVVDHDERGFSVDVMAETLRRSSLGGLQEGSPVNLERAMAADGRFGGHIVQGHVDGTTTLRSRTPGDRWEVLEFDLPAQLARYVVEKGSITIDGVSLTVASLGPKSFTVSLIPTTLAQTILGDLAPGALVNLEVDVVAKYVERLASPGVGQSGPATTATTTTAAPTATTTAGAPTANATTTTAGAPTANATTATAVAPSDGSDSTDPATTPGERA